MSYGEAALLAEELLQDPSSRLFASVADWKYPLSHEGLIALAAVENAATFATAEPDRPIQFTKPPDPRPKARTTDQAMSIPEFHERIRAVQGG